MNDKPKLHQEPDVTPVDHCERCGAEITGITAIGIGGGYLWVYLCDECIEKMVKGVDGERMV